jgi:4-aminobutyrate aminotransferase
MPIGAIVAKESVSTWEHGAHGSTFGGNPVCCAAALATLDIVQRELVSNAKARGERLGAGLTVLAARHACIGEVRGIGLMQGIEFVSDRTTGEPAGDLVRRLEQMAFAKGLLVLAAGNNALRLAPPLVVDDDDVDTALEILGRCLDELD